MYNDAVIANRVREAILLNPAISAQDIIITSHNRVVTLLGDVDTPDQVAMAEIIAASVDGVAAVENGLFVRAGHWPPTESEILPRPQGRG